jgi:hypothetical protein
MCEPISATAATAALVASMDAGVVGAGAATAAAVAAAGPASMGSAAAAGAGIFGGLGSASGMLGAAGSVASMGLGMIGKGAQTADQTRLYIANAENVNRALAQSYNANSTRQHQEADRAQQDNFDVVRSMAEAKGKASAAAGEAGVGGVSFANIMSDFEMRTGNTVSKTNANYAMNDAQIQSEQYAAESRTKAAINSTPRPSELGMYAGMAADGAKAGLKIYDIYNTDPAAVRASA